MAFDPNNSGTLSENRKTKPSQPDYRGKGMVEGMWVWISGWWKKNDRGEYMSLSFKPMTDADIDQYCSGSEGNAVSRQQEESVPGYDGPGQGTARTNRDSRQQTRRPAPGQAPVGSMFPTGDENQRFD